jgi:putative addiction module component (TIGR02574 family)
MAVSLESLGWDGLSVEEKLELVGRLWDDIVATVPPGGLLSDAQREELRRRVADAQAHPEDYVAWEDALAATLRRLSQ